MTSTPASRNTAKRSPGKRADALANQRAILEAALVVFGRDPNASLGDVAKEAGVVRRTVYAHYASREDLMLAVARDIGEQFAVRTAGIEDGATPLTTLARFVYTNSAAVARLHNLGRVAAAPGVREALSAETAAVRERIVRLLEQAEEGGDLQPGIPPRLGMRAAAAVQWEVFEAVAAGDLAEDDAPIAAVRSVLGAVGATPSAASEAIASLGA